MKVNTLRGALILFLGGACTGGAQAQYLWDVGVHLGGANYLGEFGGVNNEGTRRNFVWDTQLQQTRWAAGFFARRKLNNLISVNAGLMYLRLQGGDYLSSNPERVGRNLSFRNDLFEFYARPEITLFQDYDLGGRGRYRTDFRLFAYVGGSVYLSNPKGQINHTGDFYALRDLETEGHAYSSLGLAVPAGIGMHFTFQRRHRFGWDFGWRTTFSDYIDDASTTYVKPSELPGGANGLSAQLADQSSFVDRTDNADIPAAVYYGPGALRGNPAHNDSYMTMTFTYSYVLRGQSNFYRAQYSWMRGKSRIGRRSRAKF